MKTLTPSDLAAWLADPGRPAPVVLDVREPWELQRARIAAALHVPMATVPAALAQIPRDRPVVCVCHHGMRSLQVAYFLARQGYDDVYNLTGGIHAWATHVDPTVGVY